MAKLPRLTGRELIGFLEREGFIVSRIRGSHHVLEHADGRRTVVPCHSDEELGPGLLNKIIKQDLGMTREEFLRLT